MENLQIIFRCFHVDTSALHSTKGIRKQAEARLVRSLTGNVDMKHHCGLGRTGPLPYTGRYEVRGAEKDLSYCKLKAVSLTTL